MAKLVYDNWYQRKLLEGGVFNIDKDRGKGEMVSKNQYTLCVEFYTHLGYGKLLELLVTIVYNCPLITFDLYNCTLITLCIEFWVSCKAATNNPSTQRIKNLIIRNANDSSKNSSQLI